MAQPYHVVPNKGGGGNRQWTVKRGGADRAYSHHRKKSTAVDEGKKVALRNHVGLVVHRQDGTVSYGHDYKGLQRSFPQLASRHA